MADSKVVQLLVAHGVLTEELARAVEARVAEGDGKQSVIEHVLATGAVTEEQVARTLSEKLRIPFVNLAAFPLDSNIGSFCREDLVTRYKILPIKVQNNVLTVACINPLDREGLRAIEFATGKTVRPEVATLTALRDAIEHAYHLEDALNTYLDGVPAAADEPVAELAEESTDLNTLIRGTQLPPVVKLLNLIMVDAVRAAASDIHIEASPSEVRVRYRIDGVLHESFRLPKWVQDPLTARCKVLASLDITERRVPQDGAIRIRYQEKMIDLRVSSLPTQYGEKVTMRILDPALAPKSLAVLELEPRDLVRVRQAIRRPQGMVLVTGPTGSGKTTTLYAMLKELISPTHNIVTIENPIEYQLRGVNQVEINEKQGLTFAGTLRSILRQDPDIILVGEIRDAETAEIAIRAAQTGHLVLSTLHTNDSVATINRLLDLGIDPFLIANSLHAIVAQRLVRKICAQCAEPYEPDASTLQMLHIEGNGPYLRGRGCSACRRSGYAGRQAVYEVLTMTPPLARLIEARTAENEFRRQARADGLITLGQNAIAKVLAGVTTAEEMLRVVDLPSHTASCPACGHTVEDAFALCPSCGTSLRSQCAGCNRKLEKGWQTCPYCGKRVPEEVHIESVPRAAPPETPAPPANVVAEEPPASGEPESRRYRALVVDDERDFRFLLKMFLQQSGLPIDVDTAANGKEAIDIALERPPDIILLDIMMPEMDGFEVCRQLRANLRTTFVPILMLTALDDATSRTRGFLAGTDDYVGKPFDRRELLARVARVMQRTYGVGLPADGAPIAEPHAGNGHSAELSA